MVGNEWISKINSKDRCLTLISSSCFAAVPSVSKALTNSSSAAHHDVEHVACDVIWLRFGLL